MSVVSARRRPEHQKPQKVATPVDAALEALLERPDIGPGTKLPTERALADELKVPRSAVRAAMSRLEAQQRVVRITGSGTYVAETTKPQAATPAAEGGRDASPMEIMETRLLVEPCLAAPVVARGNSADLETIRAAMQHCVDAPDYESFEKWDGVFHQAIAEATHNRLLIEVYRTITTSREQVEWGEMKRLSINEERRDAYNREHAEIVAALQARNIARAEAALRAHLVTVRHNLLGI